jgi:phosphoglycolate phosphatase-like HAD superfamily hydrolase
MIHRETPGVFDEVCGYRPNFAKGPDHFHWLQERFAVTADHCLFVGDSLSDLEKAHKAGMPFVGVTGTFRRSTFQELDPAVRTISSVAELPSALDRQPVVAEPAMLGVAV